MANDIRRHGLTVDEASKILIAQLTQKECEIFDFFKSMLKHFNLQDTVILRVVGGWVRDKLLLKAACDIDIAIEGMAGVELAEKLNEYIIFNEQLRNSDSCATGEDNENVSADKLGIASKIGVIQANPEKSKHLETAKVHVFGEEIDFVNLRTESYADGSRIPIVEFGTPKEDALRRDFCVNALFFNLKTRRVEDFTSHGLEDLENGIIRTPLDPVITFRDDPLRILRAVRFIGRLNYQPTKELIDAVKMETVLSRLITHVSRQRFGAEIVGAFSSPHPDVSLRMMGLSYASDSEIKDEKNIFYWVYMQPIVSVLTQECKMASLFDVDCRKWTELSQRYVEVYVQKYSDYLNMYGNLNCDLAVQDPIISNYCSGLSDKEQEKFLNCCNDANLQFYEAFSEINITDNRSNCERGSLAEKIKQLSTKWSPLPEKQVLDVHGKPISSRFLLVQTLIILAALLDSTRPRMYLQNLNVDIDTTSLADMASFKKKKVQMQLAYAIPRICVAQGNSISKIISQATDIVLEGISIVFGLSNNIENKETATAEVDASRLMSLMFDCDNVMSIVIAIVAYDVIIAHTFPSSFATANASLFDCSQNIIIYTLRRQGIFGRYSLGEWKYLKPVVGGKFLMEIANKCQIKNKTYLSLIKNAVMMHGFKKENYMEWISSEQFITHWLDNEGGCAEIAQAIFK